MIMFGFTLDLFIMLLKSIDQSNNETGRQLCIELTENIKNLLFVSHGSILQKSDLSVE